MTAPLTREQKVAGRAFRAKCEELFAALEEAFPAKAHCPVHIVWYRHECLERGSWAMHMREHRRETADKLFAWIWREGSCQRCGLTVRSTRGRIVTRRRRAEKGAVLHAEVG